MLDQTLAPRSWQKAPNLGTQHQRCSTKTTLTIQRPHTPRDHSASRKNLLNHINTAKMVKKRANKYGTPQRHQARESILTLWIAVATRVAVAMSSPFDAPTARDAHQRTRQSRDSRSGIWWSPQLSVGLNERTKRMEEQMPREQRRRGMRRRCADLSVAQVTSPRRPCSPSTRCQRCT